MPTWAIFIWVGVIASLMSWAVAWTSGAGLNFVELAVPIVTTPLAWNAFHGGRWTLPLLLVAGLFVLLLALFFLVALVAFGQAGEASVADWLGLAILPLVSGLAFVAGSLLGMRARRRRSVER
jgi:hypothetical protein